MRPHLFFAAALLAAPAAQATVLVSNLAEPERFTTTLDANFWAGQSFINDSSTWGLIDIRTVVGDEVGAPTVTAELRSGSETGTLLTTFTTPSFTGAHSARTFTPLSAVTLNPGATYWFVLKVAGQGSVGWTYADTNLQTGTGSISNYSYSDDQAATWGCCGSGNASPYLFEVNVRPGGAVPEPATWALMILGFGAAGAALRRRRAGLA